MKDHQRAKESMRTLQLDNVVRRATIAYGGQKSDSEIREMAIADPQGLIRDAIMEEASDEAQAAYSDAQSRAKDVEMLVRSLNEVATMFQDLAVLITQQSEMLDSIEENVEQAGAYVKKGNEALRGAIEAQKKARKVCKMKIFAFPCVLQCMCCVMIVVIIIVCILIGGLGSFFGGAFKTG
jgi:t-SNARE complex subunit (syntaxin)